MNAIDTLIHSARLVSGGRTLTDAFVAFSGDRVAMVGTGSETDWSTLRTAETTVIDAAGRWLTPGFIDIHCHGAGGVAFDAGADAIRTALAVHHQHGSTRVVLSLVTASIDDLESQLSVIADEADLNPLILGAHLEGPFIDDTYRGAHDPTLLRTPDAAPIARLIQAGRGHIVQVTLAPELPGAPAAIQALTEAGIAVAVGHSSTDYDTALGAFASGATILTHAFNGMRGIHHRAPGPVAAATHTSAVTLEIINDGVHVHPEVVRLAFAGAPGRIALITDAMAATGSSDGSYMLGTLAVTVTDGVARLSDGGSIAGSTLTLDGALRRAVVEVGLSIEEAVTALTETPARAIGRAHDLGRLDLGYAADAVLLNDDFEVEAVFGAGIRLY
ncbi:N-acetylglucosamine-6-phosphate deacetylase [Glaciibacter psychrotolerans]|uniref:N-acetylglucosamine-6-phosphate deacetylase n=1 Tax=Glaciibacter psychrotolerans TaxID=670054 RepID=A0A7Z0J7I9_9MICO|nr:N-acetylglucosamine-6-phosphate deacetylase [Leifsonia psychrotolerans]NYJ21667.1 N-acetylglucosamine-6-phosphate deacetylase [Leifsonia psychrotolerans]